MRAKLFWLTATLLLAAAIHLSYVLFVPQLEMESYLEAFRERVGTNTLKALTSEDQRDLMKQADPHLMSAICVLDLSAGPVLVTASIPAAYWSMSIYSAQGASIYTLNDRQAGVDRYNLEIRQSEGTWQEKLSPRFSVSTDDQGTATIEMEQSSALVIMRSFAEHRAARPLLEGAFRGSSCKAKAEPSG